MTTYTTTASGHKIEVRCWESNGLNFQIHIDGELFVEGSTLKLSGDTEYYEAYWQAHTTATDIKHGRIRRIDGKWRFIEDAELVRGAKLSDALDIAARDEWMEAGLPEEATEDSTWSFCGWNVVRGHLRRHGWVMLGGDLYAVPKAAPEETKSPNATEPAPSPTLPPDPDDLNGERSQWAQAALDAFIKVTELPTPDHHHALSDLLCNLRHWCDRNGRIFDVANECAHFAYLEETAAEVTE